MCVHECVCISTQIYIDKETKVDRDFKELTHMMMAADKSKIHRAGQQAKDPG